MDPKTPPTMIATTTPNLVSEKLDAQHVEQLVLEAQTAEQADHESTPWKTVVANPKIVLCCLYANIGAMMYGFDNLALSLCLSMPAFQAQFGSPIPGGQFLIPAYWQSLWNALAQICTMIGASIAGPFQDFAGRRASFVAAALISAAGVAVVYTATTPSVFLAGKMVNGIALGMCQTTGQTYVSEIAPLQMRGMALSIFTTSMNLGFMIAASIAFDRVTIMNASAYRVVFAAGWAWPAILLACVFLIPESPYSLVVKNNHAKAERMLQRLSNKNTDVSAALSRIITLNAHERQITAESKDVSFIDCFKGTNWRRTRIILYCNGLSQVVGASFIANGPYFLVQAGLSPTHIAMMVEIGISFAIASSLITTFLMSRWGRRRMIIFGVSLSGLFFLLMGIAGCFPHSSSALWVVGISLQLLWWTFGPSIGPAMAMAGEISAIRLRAKSLSIGFTFNYFFSTVWNVVVPYMFNSDQGNLGGKIGWIYLALVIPALAIIYFEFPETKGRSFAELDEMFEGKVKTRKFRTYETNGHGVEE